MSTTNDSPGARTTARGSAAPPARPRGGRPAKEPKRRTGIVAEEAQLRARVELARALGDPAEERAAAHKLAELLAVRGVELDVAVELVFRTLSAHDSCIEIRYALVRWLEGLGEPGLAASELRKLAAGASGPDAAAILVRIGVLHARAGDAVGAHEALAAAAEVDEADALPLELLGGVAAWATATHGGADLDVDGSPGPRAGAEAYVRAARRRAAARDTDGEMENVLRAFELDPSSPLAVAALVNAYVVRGRDDAADQVLRVHASALASAHGSNAPAIAEVHARRRTSALGGGRVGAALGAALDEHLDAAFDGPAADLFDDMLARVGAYEPLAVRLEVRAEREKGRAAAVRWAELGRLLLGPVAVPDRALEAFARAVAADASNAENVHALRALCQKEGDATWLVEALVRAAMGAAAHGSLEDNGSRLAAARELASLGEEKNDALLSAWAYRVMSELDARDERTRAAAGRLEGVVKRQEEELALARQALETSAADGLAVALLEVVRLARSLPDASRELARVLLELAELRVVGPRSIEPALQDEDPIFTEAVRVAERVGDFEGIARLAALCLDARGSNVRVRGVLVRALRQAGDLPAASVAARAFAEESATRWTGSVAWITAAAAGDERARGYALAAVAPACGSQVAATVSAVSAEVLADVGETEAARRAAEQACRGGSANVRALLVLARLATAAEGRVAQAAVERALENAGPSAHGCAKLSGILEEAGDMRGAVAWARRRVALRPGEPAAAQALVDCAIRAGDAEALAEALGWLAPQPQPSKEMAERLAPALEALGALDPARAAALGRRALALLGPRQAPLRRAIEQVASAAADARLRATLGERWIAAGAPVAERGPLLLQLADRYRELGDVDDELRAYARAAREGVDLSPRAERIDELASQAKTPDAELALLEAWAELRLVQGDARRAADAFRELGAALWDMAGDRPRAVQAWLRGARCDAVHGDDTLRRDLTSFAGAQYAVDCLAELVERERDPVRSGALATQAARAALDARANERALGLAKIALERDPGHADALETAEIACAKLARVREMSPIYDEVARRARGRFGRRAAHHRAARFFEAGGVVMMALKHAAQAFIAVPSEGSTLSLLQRTAAKARRQSIAVRAVEHVAELARSPHARAAWLLRAARMTTPDLDGRRQKVDLLLKASVLAASPATLGMLAAAAREVLALAPEDTEAVALRLERAGDQLAKGLEGPDGARIAITFADMATGLFSDGAWGWRSLERAIGADADVDEYEALVAHAPAFAEAAGAPEALERVMVEVDKPYSNVGHALLRLVGAIAERLGDKEKRAKVLVRAAEKAPDDDALVVEADEAARQHGDPRLVERLSERGIDALQHRVRLARAGEAGEELRVVLKQLARAEGARGALSAAEAAWREVIAIDPADAEADVAIEALLVARASFDDLSEHLAERASRLAKSADPEDEDKLRAVRLRRAAILEQRLGRLEDACVELEHVLADRPEHPGAARWLADLYERSGQPQKALPALERLFLAASEELEYLALGVRRARALVAVGEPTKARSAVEDLRSRVPNVLAVAEVRVEVARALSDPRELGAALADLARLSVDDPRSKSAMLIEAAQAAARAGDGEASLARAREAARFAPDVASTQLFARGLEYRFRGPGTSDDALATIASLEPLLVDAPNEPGANDSLEPDDVALCAFLLAEAEDVVRGVGAGEETLRRALAQVGERPLIALGLAERAAKGGRHEEARRFYAEAVHGNLLGLRRPGRVAMAAASSAQIAGDVASTRRFLDEAANDPETRTDARRRLAELAPPRADDAEALAPPAQAPTPASELPTTTTGKVAKARARLVFGSRDDAERLLFEALSEGSIEAADLLDPLLAAAPARGGELLKVRRQAVELNPGSVARLTALRDAARADQNTNYVRAIDHVLCAIDPAAGPLAPPPLTAQNAQPGMFTLLTRPSREPAGASFGVVWEGAPALFAKSPSAVGLAGLERVVPGSTTALSRVYEAALRLLDTPRCVLFHAQTSGLEEPREGDRPSGDDGAPRAHSALFSPPAALLTGDVEHDSADLRWALGEALACMLSENVLVLGLERAEAAALWSVLLGAFGPPGLVTVDRKDAQLADTLWQTLAPRTQRKLKELLSSEGATPFDRVLSCARQSGRHVGMFLTGDFGHAARRLLADLPQADPGELERPGGLERLCARFPSLADLLRLAVCPEYADARWRLPSPGSLQRVSGAAAPV